MQKALAGFLLGTALACLSVPAWAVDDQVVAKCVHNSSAPTPADGTVVALQCDADGKLITSGGGGGGAGDASAANQATQITHETATATGVGAPADSAWVSGSGSIIAVLKGIQGKLSAALAVTQSGTWTVQPGNTANTTAWKVDGSAVTQPVSIATAPVLVAGSAIIGKVGIDQTTPGTTNAVSATNFPTTAALGHGTAATALRVELPTDGTGVVSAAQSGTWTMQPGLGSTAFTATSVNGTTAAITDTTSTQILASAGASTRNYVAHCRVSNSHATVGTFVKILDGSTIIDEAYAAAVGGGWSANYAPAMLKGTAATAVNCQPVTTGANVICSCGGFTGT